MKDSFYWVQVNEIASTIATLSQEIQGPLIDKHVDSEMAESLDVEEIISHIEQFYTEEDKKRWRDIEQIGVNLARNYQLDINSVLNDIWSVIAHVTASSDHPHH